MVAEVRPEMRHAFFYLTIRIQSCCCELTALAVWLQVCDHKCDTVYYQKCAKECVPDYTCENVCVPAEAPTQHCYCMY